MAVAVAWLLWGVEYRQATLQAASCTNDRAPVPAADAVAAPVTLLVSLVAARFTRCRVDALRWIVLFLLCSLADFLYFYVMPLCACVLSLCLNGLEATVYSCLHSLFMLSCIVTVRSADPPDLHCKRTLAHADTN